VNTKSMLKNRIAQTEDKILGFKSLPSGWYFGEGVPPSEDTVRKAIELNRDMSRNGFNKTDAFPGSSGEICVTGYYGSIYLEFTLEFDGLITYALEQDDAEIEYKENLSFDDARSLILSFWGEIWHSLGLSTAINMTERNIVLARSHLSHPVTEVESLLLMETAPYKQVQVSAPTPKGFTAKYQEILLSFGSLTQNYYRMATSS
jgi:hypothetical protein